jgi:hypothetical protein
MNGVVMTPHPDMHNAGFLALHSTTELGQSVCCGDDLRRHEVVTMKCSGHLACMLIYIVAFTHLDSLSNT